MLVETETNDVLLGELSYEADLCGNIEQALKGLQGYGIMALELIQNADDAGAQTLSFNATTNGLVVRNDADFTSCGLHLSRCPWESEGDQDGRKRPCNFHAISRMGGRSKLRVDNQTGRFGIGFVSVYQIADTPIVRSVGTQIILNPLTGKVSTGRTATAAGTEFELQWASTPSDIRNALNAAITPPDVAERFVSEVQEVLRSSLLFLRHLERVELRKNGSLCLAVQIKRKDDGITLTFSPGNEEEKWLVLSRLADDIIAERELLESYEQLGKLHRSTRVSMALALGKEPGSGLFYAYLPTRQETKMPLHINADFFPHASRQHIVREGEGHERYWNEALLAAAAAIVAENFASLRDRLGHKWLWQLGADSYKLRSENAFDVFWEQFSKAAKSTDSVWTTAGKWFEPHAVHWPPDNLSADEQIGVTSLGLSLLNPDLRPHLNALSAAGVKELRLNAIVSSEPRRVCRRPQLVRSRVYDKQNDEQILS